LARDPANTTALFGSGAALHHLGMYRESSDAMDLVLAGDLARRGRAIPDSIRYHRSEALFYKANNSYLLGDRAKAREFVDAAKAIAPDLEHANYLSALLRYEGDEPEAARREFQELLRRGTSICRANYYLGRLLHDARDKQAADHFLAACSCMQRTVQTMERQVGDIPRLELEEAEKVSLRGRLERKIHDFRLESAGLIDSMVRIVESSWDWEAQRYVGPMIDLLGRIRPAPAVP
jgi:tetratricopeptide (TPR) repeat protein